MQRGRGRPRGGGREGDRGRGRGGGGRHFGWMSLEEAQSRVRNTLSGLRLTTTSAKKFEELTDGQFAPRPDPGGKAGKGPIKILTNFYKMKCGGPQVYHYDVEIQQATRALLSGEEEVEEEVVHLPTKLNRAILSKCAESQGWSGAWAYDGRRGLYTPLPLIERDVVTYSVDMSERGRQRMFKVKITKAAVLSIGDIQRYLQQGNIRLPHKTLSALEICLKASFANDANCVAFPRTFFFMNEPALQALPGGLEIRQGHIQSGRITANGLVLNVDVAYAAFLKEQPMLDYVLSLTNKRSARDLKNMSERDWKRLGRELKGIEIITTHLSGSGNKKHKCVGFTKQPANALEFTLQDGTMLNVANYWQTKYGALTMPWLPCIDASKNKRKLNYLPLEVCRITGGQRRTNLTGEQTREFIKTSASRPNDRLHGIRQALRKSAFNTNPLVGAFGLQIDDKEIEANGRVLPQPMLQYKTPPAMDAGNRGAWNLEDVVLYIGGELKSWALVSFANNTQAFLNGQNGLFHFMRGLIDMMRKMGLAVGQDMPPFIDAGRLHTKEALGNAAEAAKTKYNTPVQLIMVLLPNKDSSVYKEIKRTAEGELGLMTQCFVAPSAGIGKPPKGQLQFMANLTVKINQKIGGKNWKLAGSITQMFPAVGGGRNRPFIVFGADVTHPPPGMEAGCSVGAVVASMDIELSVYSSRIVLLPPRQETLDMSDAIRELLLCFYQKNGVKPETVLFYRDGVSDGQFDPVMRHERNEFKEAFRKLDPDYSPPMTYIVVKKRHHVRMFPDGNNADRNGNALPGTIIDTGITSKYDFDFYLNSHAGIQGTNKPAHYYTLLDENGFGSDGLQLFTYSMCYLYCRCTRSVSYAPPAYYAHLAAFHGKYLTETDITDTSSIEGERATEHAQIHDALKDRMFFV